MLTLSRIEDTIPRYEAHIDRSLYKALHDARRKLKRHLVARGFDVEEILALFDART